MVKMHRPALIGTVFDSVISIGPRSSCRDEQIVWLTVALRRGVVAVVMHSHSSSGWVEVIRKGDVSRLPGRSPNSESGVCPAVRPHVCAWSIQYLYARLIDTDRHVRLSC